MSLYKNKRKIMIATVLTFLFAVAIVCVVLYLVNKYIALDPPFRQIVNAVIVLVFVAWVAHKYVPGLGI